jgi:hypothetical protein
MILAAHAAALVLGVLLAVRATGRTPAERVLLALLPSAIGSAAVVVADELLSASWRSWNDARLAPMVAWARGEGLYAPADSGAVLGNIYPPLGTLAYLPAALAPDPEAMTRVGGLMALVFVLAPLIAVLVVAGRRCGAGAVGVASAACVLVVAMGQFRALSLVTYWVHVDAPAVGFGALACGAVALSRNPGGPRAVALASAACALSACCKQVMLPIALAVLVVAGVRAGRRAVVRHAGGLAVAALVALIGAGLAFDPGTLALNVVTIPSRHPWTGEPGPALAAALAEWLSLAALPLAVVAADAAFAVRRGERLAALASMPWAVAGLLMLPMALLGRVKVGGAENALGVSVAFLVPAALVALLRRPRPAAWTGVREAALALLVLAATIAAVERSVALPDVWAARASNPERVMLDFERRHPGQAWFAGNPLIALHARGRADHLSYGLYDRELAGLRPSPDHVAAHLPRPLRWVVTTEVLDVRRTWFLPVLRRVPAEGVPATILVLEPVAAPGGEGPRGGAEGLESP